MELVVSSTGVATARGEKRFVQDKTVTEMSIKLASMMLCGISPAEGTTE